MLAIALCLLSASPRLGVIVERDEDRAAVLDALATSARFTAVPMEEMKKHVASAASLGIHCGLDDAPCLARVGAFAKTPYVLVVCGSDAAAEAMLVDASSSLARRARSPLSPPSRAATVRALVAAALAGEQPTGSLAIDAEAGAAVDVDGAARGAAPLTVALAPGPHTLHARSGDGREATQEAVVSAGVVGHASLTFKEPGAGGADEHPPAPGGRAPDGAAGDGGRGAGAEGGPSALLLAGGGAAGLAALAAVGMAAAALVVTPDPAHRSDVTAREFNDASAAGQALWIGAAIAAVVVVAGGAVAVAGALE